MKKQYIVALIAACAAVSLAAQEVTDTSALSRSIWRNENEM
jgi:hypothetical protein